MPSPINGSVIEGAGERPPENAPNSADRKSSACTTGATPNTVNAVTALKANRLPDVRFMGPPNGYRCQYSDDAARFIAWCPVAAAGDADGARTEIEVTVRGAKVARASKRGAAPDFGSTTTLVPT